MRAGDLVGSRLHPAIRAAWIGLLFLVATLGVRCKSEFAPAGESDLAPFRQPALIDPPVSPPASLITLASQAQPARFNHLPPEAGLSQSVVTDILQDDLGFLWLATQDGLNRYDGYEFRIFKAGPGQTPGLTGNLLNSLDKAPTGEIWIGGSDNGLTRFDPRTGQFTSFLHDPGDPRSLSENTVLSLDVDEAGYVWAGTANAGLNRLDPATGFITRYMDTLSAPSITGVVVRPEAIWLGTYGGGLDRLDPVTGDVVVFRHDPADPRTLGNDIVNTVFVDHAGIVWIGTLGGGLSRLDPVTGQMARLAHNPDDPFSLAHDNVTTIFEDSDNRLWVGTAGGGLNLLDRQSGHFTRYSHDPLDAASLGSDYVQSLYEDRSGILWIGTFGAGADSYDPYKNKFMTIRARPQEPDGLSSNNVWGLIQDGDGAWWFSTNDAGVSRLDSTTGLWRRYLFDPTDPGSLASNTVYTVYIDPEGVLWTGTTAGLSRFNAATETFTNYPMAPVMAILEDSRGDFWVGSMMGLSLFDRVAGTVLRTYNTSTANPNSLSSDAVDILFEDRAGHLWVGTINGGLNLFDPLSGDITRFVHDSQQPGSLSNNVVLDIYQTGDDTLWIGTTNGLNRFEATTGKFTAYGEREGLPNDVVYCILEDDVGHLWFSTNKGLVHFDPKTLALRTYDQSDGLQGSEFNQWSCYRNDEGVMVFGGVNGVNVFHPGLIRDNPFVPPVVITNFSVFNEPVVVEPDGLLTRPVEVTDAVELPYTDNFFEFEYAALHFSSPDEIRYATMMEGLDAGWNDVSDRRFATFTSIPPGDYTFRVRATNSDGVWSGAGAALRVTIPPPYWQTWWFRLVAALALIGAVSAIFWLRLRGVEQQRRKLEQQVAERTSELRQAMDDLATAKDAAEAASRAKSTFLANMSHEFRTPLNAILGFTQILNRDRRLPPDLKGDVKIINHSGDHLLGLINDVLDMSKIEAGRTTLRLENFDLHDLLLGLEEMFVLRAGEKGLDLRLDLAPDVPRFVRGDEGKLRQVLMNLLGNAVKFTATGEVTLCVGVESSANGSTGRIRFAVRDTGPGILPEELEGLFEPFVQSKTGHESPEGTGLGLAISRQFVRLMGGEIVASSQPGVGSEFVFTVPLAIVAGSSLERPRPVRQVIGLAAGQPDYRLLIVDDQEVNRKLLRRLLEPLGFAVREAVNGQEAIDSWQAWEPHLIWMDMRMPVMDGYEATRRIKSTTKGMATIIIAITASALEEDRVVILSEGCDDYLRKPFQEQELYDALAEHLGVVFVYESLVTDATAIPGDPTPRPELVGDELAIRLASMSDRTLSAIERAVTLGDVSAIETEIGKLSARDPSLGAALRQLADNFEHDRILSLIAAARQPEKGRG